MDLISAVKERRSVRKFSEQKVDRELIKKIVEVAKYAPTWAHQQICRFTVIDNHDQMMDLAEKGMSGFVHNMNIIKGAAGVIILSVVTGKSGCSPQGEYISSKGNGWEMFDAGIAAQSLCLVAHSHGIGTLIQGIFDDLKIAELIDLPENEVVEAVIPFGYPATIPNTPPRKELKEILRFRD